MEDGEEVGLKFTALTITLSTDKNSAAEAQFLPSDLERVTVYADTVTILGRIDLPGTTLRIVARQLLCAAGYAQCVINTSGRRNETSLLANAKPAQKGSGFGDSGVNGAAAAAACGSG